MADSRPEFPPLGDRYTRLRGRIHLTGVQALVRLPLDQVRLDRNAGHRIGALISGYPGSPLAGYEQELRWAEPVLREAGVRFIPGLSEELAAGAVYGTQLLDRFPHSAWEGVVGIWYGKAPGLDRSLDAIRHANFVGTGRFGGALAVVGDDPTCKSSSLPSHSEYAFAHALMPVLAAADAADVLSLGLHGFALSRYAGLWVGLEVVADVADGGAIFEVADRRRGVELPKFQINGHVFESRLDTRLLPPHVNRIEQQIFYERFEAVRRYAWANNLNPILHRHARDRTGLVASGHLYRELESALERLELDDAELEKYRLRLLKIDLLYPLETRRLAEFADGLDEIIVIDQRRGFLEDQIRAALYNSVDHPMVLGQRDENGHPWLSRGSSLTAETLAIDLGTHLAERLHAEPLRARVERLRKPPEQLNVPQRSPVFCSGCPHSHSTRLPADARAGGGIGCHTMALLMDRNVEFIGAMGGEGSPWIGLNAFVDTPHLFQNLGDGTYFHSGRQAVRACVEAGVPMTFKLLYNGAIAMTGGQHAVGCKPVCDVVRDLLADGVRKIVAVSKDPDLRAFAMHHPDVECIAREAYENAMQQLRYEPGVTAIVYDQLCANQKQRQQRRGLRNRPDEQVLINQDVCEGCGDCGRASNCISLRPVQTELGRKILLHEPSCSDDRTCLVGDCPAFVSIPAMARKLVPASTWKSDSLPEPERAVIGNGRFEIYMVGVGSTGVVSTNALLMRAAEIDQLFAIHLDQTGLAQRGGKVVSHCILSHDPIRGSARVTRGRADLLFAFDPITACDAVSLPLLDRERTRAVVHELFSPTAEMISKTERPLPDLQHFIDALGERTESLLALPAETLVRATLDAPLTAHTLLVGAALQRGLLPLSVASLEQAMRERGIAVELNLQALALGRALVAEHGLSDRVLFDTKPPGIGTDGSPEGANMILGDAWQAFLRDGAAFTPSAEAAALQRRVAAFAADLVDYQSRAWARRYLETLRGIVRAEAACTTESVRLSSMAARELYRLMAYKDEYEVARLHLRGPFRRWLERQYAAPVRMTYFLQPPLLRTLGLQRKLALGRWIEPVLRVLVGLRRLRGTWLDPFGQSRVRRTERRLIRGYEQQLRKVAADLTGDNYRQALERVGDPNSIRGYEQIKLSRASRLRP